MTPHEERVEAFRRLHAEGCFVMPNPWDVGSAVALEQMGFKALATTSAGHAWTLARPDKLNMIKPLRWTGPSLYDLAGDRLRACTPTPSNNGDGPHLRQSWRPRRSASRRLCSAVMA